MIKLRPYQISATTAIYNNWKTQNRLLLQMPTGSGKTTVFSYIAKEFTKKSNLNDKVLILVHRRELVEQIIERLKRFQVYPGYILSGKEYENNHKVYVGSIQTINRREIKPKQFTLIIIDEAHHVPSKSYQKIIDFYNHDNLKILGVTATPIRLDNKGFNSSFDRLISSWTINKFTEEGYLCPIRHFVSGIPDLTGIKKQQSTGDYDLEELAARMLEEKVMSDLIESYKKHADNKKMIVFAVNRKHSIEICGRYNKEGYPAMYIDCKTPSEERAEILNDFKNNKIKILCNVNIFTEGFDCPDVEVVQLARPTKSLSLYFQQVGRAMRPKPNNADGIVLDNANNWAEHGLVNKNIIWTLNGAKVEKSEILTTKEKLKKGESIDIKNSTPDEIKGLELIEVSKTEILEKKKEYVYRKLLIYFKTSPNEFIETNYSFFQYNKNGLHSGYIRKNIALIGSDRIPYDKLILFIEDQSLIKRVSTFFTNIMSEKRLKFYLDHGSLRKTFPFGIEFDYIRGRNKIDRQYNIKTSPFYVIDAKSTTNTSKVSYNRNFTVSTYPKEEVEKEIENALINAIFNPFNGNLRSDNSTNNLSNVEKNTINNITSPEQKEESLIPNKILNLLEIRLNINNNIRTLKFEFEDKFPKKEFLYQKITKKVKANVRTCNSNRFSLEFYLNESPLIVDKNICEFELVKNKIRPFKHDISFLDLYDQHLKQN